MEAKTRLKLDMATLACGIKALPVYAYASTARCRRHVNEAASLSKMAVKRAVSVVR